MLCGSVKMNAAKYELGPSSIEVMRMERMRRAAPERQKGLDVNGLRGGVKEGINAGQPFPPLEGAGGIGCREEDQR